MYDSPLVCKLFYLYVSLLICHLPSCYSDCAMLDNCNGHGQCMEATSTCACFEGWGAATDLTFYHAPDCSARVCPSGRAWADVPTSSSTAHRVAECSNRGTCNRKTGECTCFAGFTGPSCNRNLCPNDCSGHGVCVSIKDMAKLSNALPLNANTLYEGEEDSITWDEEMSYGCVCDSSWDVGLEAGQRQEPEWFGADCSLRHCPSADNPVTNVDETDCGGKAAANSIAVGQVGNLCQVDCSNNGICDNSSGTCRCFRGFYGVDCTKQDVLATGG